MAQYVVIHTHKHGASVRLVECDFDLFAYAPEDREGVELEEGERCKLAEVLNLDYEPERNERVEIFLVNGFITLTEDQLKD